MKNKVMIILGLMMLFIFSPMETNASWDQDTSITYDKILIHSTMTPPAAIYVWLKKECYEQNVRDKWHCIKTGLAIAYAEASWKDSVTPFGLQSHDKSYRKWVSSYNKYWYKSTNAFFFYGDWGQYGKSHYCTSEESSGSAYGCPNWRKNMQRVLDDLKIN